MRATFYKLGEYKIIESGTGELRWEAHFGFGARQGGRCFRKGRILFIGPAESDRPGFLKGEFLDHLKPFPAWLKTKCFCRGLDIYHCKTGKKVTKVEMQLWMLDGGIDEEDRLYSEKPGQHLNNISTKRATVDVAFRLQKYEIIEKTNNQFVWRTYAGPNTVSGGNCIILEDILFIGSWQNEQSTMSKRQFLQNIQKLPKWDQTKYFCPKLSLHESKTGNRVQEERKGWPGEIRATETQDVRQRYKKRTESKLKKTDLLENRVIIFACWIRKYIIYAAALMFMIISLFFDYLIRFWKALKGRWHSRKGKRSSIDHSDDEI